MEISTFQSSPTNTTSNLSRLTTQSADQDAATIPQGCLVFDLQSGDFIPWENPQNIFSQNVPEVLDTIVGYVFLPVFFLISAPTNVLSMLVFWRQGLKERINLCLFYLSLVDFLHMLHAFFCNVDRFYLPFLSDAEYGPVLEFIVDNRLLGFRSLSWLSGFVSMIIACERCLCVVSPLRSQTILSTRTTGVVLLLGTVFCVTGSLVNGMRWSLPCVFDPLTNSTYKKLLTSQFYARNRARLNVLSLFVATLQPLTYLAVILGATVTMAVRLRRLMAWRERSSSYSLSSQDLALTRMLIAVSVLYIICSIPNMTLGIGVMFVPGMSFSGRYYNLTIFLIDLMEIASYVNATFNFFIYYSMGSRYKHTLRSLTRCCRAVKAGSGTGGCEGKSEKQRSSERT